MLENIFFIDIEKSGVRAKRLSYFSNGPNDLFVTSLDIRKKLNSDMQVTKKPPQYEIGNAQIPIKDIKQIPLKIFLSFFFLFAKQFGICKKGGTK